MTENKEKEESCEGGSCCSSSGCGACCLTGKVLIVALILLVGGILGYLLAGNCHMKKMCGMGGMSKACPMMPAEQAPSK